VTAPSPAELPIATPILKSSAPSPDAPLPALELLKLKDTSLYESGVESSDLIEKTLIKLPKRAKVRINQYRPLADLSKVLPDRDLIQVLRSAESTWKISESETGHDALARLITQKAITSADQFFLNGDHLGLMFRDEIDSDRRLAFLRGVWKIHPFTKLYADLVSRQAFPSLQAAQAILNHENLPLLATLAPDTSLIRAAAEKTPRDRRPQDNRQTIILAANHIETIAAKAKTP
jgi:hypothetical protein